MATFFGCLIASCDSAPNELIGEINAAREGCTEEMLKASDEICVEMFERYAEMAADGMETYIGGLRAFDEAVQRRGGLLFDTTGLGHAIGGGWNAGNDPAQNRAPILSPIPDGQVLDARTSGGASSGDAAGYPQEVYGPVTGGRWADPLPRESAPLPAPYDAPDPRGGQSPAPSAAPVRRGVLLPPEERLRRPWINGAADPDPYVEVQPQRRDPEPAAPYPSSGWGGEPYPTDRRGDEPYPTDRRGGGTWEEY